MKMSKASDADLKMAMALSSALDALACRFVPTFPEAIDEGGDEDSAEAFDIDDPEDCTRALNHLLELARSASLSRVVWGCAVMLDPRNRMVDPNANTIEHHPDGAAGLAARDAKPLSEWGDEDHEVLWWKFPIEEPPYLGNPNHEDWPGRHTHWTPLITPTEPQPITPEQRA